MAEGNTATEALEAAADLQKDAEIATLKARLAQYEEERVVRPSFAGEIPRYRLNGRCFLEDDTLHEEGEVIEYLGTPNLEMVPQNDAAKKRLEIYIEELSEGARQKAQMMGRPFTGLVTDRGVMLAQSLQDARRSPDNVAIVKMPTEKGQIPQMPHTPEAAAQNRRQGKAPKGLVVSAKLPPPPKRPDGTPIPVLGNQYTADAAGNKVG